MGFDCYRVSFGSDTRVSFLLELREYLRQSLNLGYFVVGLHRDAETGSRKLPALKDWQLEVVFLKQDFLQVLSRRCGSVQPAKLFSLNWYCSKGSDHAVVAGRSDFQSIAKNLSTSQRLFMVLIVKLSETSGVQRFHELGGGLNRQQRRGVMGACPVKFCQESGPV